MGPNGVCSRSRLHRRQDGRRAHRADQRRRRRRSALLHYEGARVSGLAGDGGHDGTAGVQLREGARAAYGI